MYTATVTSYYHTIVYTTAKFTVSWPSMSATLPFASPSTLFVHTILACVKVDEASQMSEIDVTCNADHASPLPAEVSSRRFGPLLETDPALKSTRS